MKAVHAVLQRIVIAVAVLGLVLPTLAAAGESLVRLPAKGPIVFEQLNRPGIEILAVDKHGMIDAIVDDKQLDYVMRLGYAVSVSPVEDLFRAAADLDENLGMYHTFAEMESLITAWETTDFPAICDVFTIGTSVEARPIYALKISDNVTVDESGETEVLYMGNVHAREIMTVELTLLFAEHLLVNYGTDPTITDHVNSKEIFFVPMVNPDGHVYVEQNHTGSSGNWWRKNRRINTDMSIGVDLNRNFGVGWGYDDVGSSPVPSDWTYRGTSAFSEPESQTIRDFCNNREFTMWLSYHSYGELLLYPWGYIAENTPDHNVFLELGNLMSATNGYLAGNLAMGAIYPVNGDTDDWGYGEQATKDKIFAFTPEVNSGSQGGFGPPDTLIAPTFSLNLDMNMLVLEYCANPYVVVGPYRPTMYAIADLFYPTHTLSWTGNDPADPNPVLHYQVERCTNPSFVVDEAEALSSNWTFDGFTLGDSAYTGSAGYYSGMGDNMNHSMTADRPYLVDAQSDSFVFWTSFAIEQAWDYAYVEVSDDDGLSWTTVEGNITTTTNPYGNNRGHGITGTIPFWVQAIFPLTDYLGQEVLLRISYVTDAAVVEHGIDVDVLEPVPTCQSVDVIASSHPDSTLEVVPGGVGTFRYRVKAVDSQSDQSAWSNSETIEITTLSDAESPLSYASRLGQNHPNPFNPVTTIPYIVGGASEGGAAQRVTLSVYDVAGRLVAKLVDEDQSPGAYQARWNGVNDRGAPVASGVYFYRLTVGRSEVFTSKLALLK
jgi:hypothetical protein